MITAFILINVNRPELKAVIDEILATEGVHEVYTVAGEYDLVAVVRSADNKQLSEIVADRLPHSVNGITHTKTLIALNGYYDLDLPKVFGL